ncbi:MAG TPA: VOC family protein [Acidimicrobiales bacterium]|nr:VOC family protein [Acidimicrobiales bacterium]
MSFYPYVFFSGNCAEAFQRYQQIFGGELQVLTNADVPEGAGMPGADPQAVMHASLTLGEGRLLMGSDDPTGDDGAKVGSAVCYVAPDEKDAERTFEALADGGEATMPFSATFWSRGFGMCTDRYGVPWMVDTKGEPEPT